MADSKITALASISTSTDPAVDPLVIVDVSDTSMAATGTTKKVTLNNLLSSSPTATGALTVTGLVTAGSATITGALAVDTTTLVANAAGYADRVGIGTATPGYPLEVVGNAVFSADATCKRFFVNDTTGTANAYINSANGSTSNIFFGGQTNYNIGAIIYDDASNFLAFRANGTERARIDSSGNLGIGVTPSAWQTGLKALQLNTNAVLYGNGTNSSFFGNNYFTNSAGDNKYLVTNAATAYGQVAGAHQWFTAASGTAGNTITFTQAMTLDASGNLLVGKTATNLQVVGCELKANGTVFSTLVDTTDAAASSYQLYSTGAAAYRFYVGLGGTVFATNTTISAISDARLKENVQDIDVGLDAILALKPRKFDWKAGKGKDIKGDRGFIAQEFETVFPNLIDEWKDPAPEGEAAYKSVRQDLIPVLVKAIQELTARVQTLEAR